VAGSLPGFSDGSHFLARSRATTTGVELRRGSSLVVRWTLHFGRFRCIARLALGSVARLRLREQRFFSGLDLVFTNDVRR
jgi:hypothetical protein